MWKMPVKQLDGKKVGRTVYFHYINFSSFNSLAVLDITLINSKLLQTARSTNIL
jgi:hypothetical protein